MNKRDRIARIYGPTPGEMAFDRCLFPFVALFAFCASRPFEEQESLRAWFVWLDVALGVFAVVLWIRALIGLLQVWRDPSSRVLRFSASVLLFGFVVAVNLCWGSFCLLFTPSH
jgi:hypothetical protein